MNINSGELQTLAAEELHLQEPPPSNVPVSYIIGNKYSTHIKGSSRSTTGTVTMLNLATLGANRRFAVTFVQINYTKDVACDGTQAYIQVTKDGLGVRIISLTAQTLTAGSMTDSLSFPFPMIIDANSTILLGTSFGAGTCTCYGIIGGFFI